MNCFPCFSSQKSKKEGSKREHDASFDDNVQSSAPENKEEASNTAENGNTKTQAFNFRELASATKNFRQECLLGEGGFGRVYKGTLQATGKVVAVKQLDRNAMEGNKEFLVEVGQLSLLQHPNLVNLIGYCADGDQRLLVYEFMPGGSLEDHLRDMKAGGKPLDWVTRMKIAYGTAQGLEYLHEKANPPVIYRDLKSSSVLLDEEFNPKLSDIGLDKLGPPSDNKMPMQSRMMDTGYCAPEYSGSGTLTAMADVYSFGVVLLELITGRRPIDTTKPVDEQNLVAWAQPLFKEPKHFPEMADPLLKKRFPERGLNQAVAIAAMCVQEEAAARPLMSDLVGVLSFLSVATEENSIPPTLPPSISSKLHCISTKLQFLECPDAGKLKVQESSVNDVNDADKQSESDDDDDKDEKDDEDSDDDEGSVSSTRSSSVNSLRKGSLTHDNSRRRSIDGGSPSFSQKSSSARSQFSLGNDSKGSHSLRQKSSKKSKFSSSQKHSKKSEEASFSSSDEDSRKLSVVSTNHKGSMKSAEDDANSSSGEGDSSDGSFSSNHQKSSKKLLDESGHASQKGSIKSTDGRTVSMSHKNSLESQDANDSLGHKSSRKLTDVISLGRKSSKIKPKVDGSSSSRHRTSSKKTPEGIFSLSRKKSHGESNASTSIRKSRRKSKKLSNDDSLSHSSNSNGGSEDEN